MAGLQLRNLILVTIMGKYDKYERYRAPASAGGARSTRIGHGMFLTRGVYGQGSNKASLTSDVFVACLVQPSWRGLAGLSPSASSGGGEAGR